MVLTAIKYQKRKLISVRSFRYILY